MHRTAALVVAACFFLAACDAMPNRAARQANEVYTAMTGIVDLAVVSLFPVDSLQEITGWDEVDDAVDVPCEEGIIRITGLTTVDAPRSGIAFSAEAVNCAYPIDRTTYILNAATDVRLSASQRTGRVFLAGRITIAPGAVIIANGDHGESASTTRVMVEETPAVVDIKNLEFMRPGVAQADDLSLTVKQALLSVNSRADYMRPVGQRIRVEDTDVTFMGGTKSLTVNMFARITYLTSPERRITLAGDDIVGAGGDICPFDGHVKITGEYDMTIDFGREADDREVVVADDGEAAYADSCQSFFSHAR